MEQAVYILGVAATLIGVCAAGIKIFQWAAKRLSRSKYKGAVHIWTVGNNDFQSFLNKSSRKVVYLDLLLDFSIGTESNHQAWSSCAIDFIAACNVQNLDSSRIPIVSESEHGGFVARDAFVLVVKEPGRLAPSFGGTGLVQVFVHGYFEVEVRAYSGPSIEYTLREIDQPRDW